MDSGLRLMGFGGRVKVGLGGAGRSSRGRVWRNGGSRIIGRNGQGDPSVLLATKPRGKSGVFTAAIPDVSFSTWRAAGGTSWLLGRSFSRRNGDDSSGRNGSSSGSRDSAAAAAAAASWSRNVGSPGRRPRRPQDFDAFGTWDSTTDLPLMVDASIAQGKPIPTVLLSSVGMSRVKGRRPYQEDQYGVEQLAPNLLYWAVFDGHGGSDCSRFCVQQMPRHIAYWMDVKTKEAAEAGSKELDLTAVLHNAFLEVNNSFARWYTFNHPGIEGDSSGTTATVVLLKDGTKLAVGHCGDSRAILCRSGEARKLTTDHVPALITEKIRIEKSGGRVSSSRVNDRLAMTRSIGDLELKRYGVIAEPEVRIVDINHSRDAFIVLTTDGINSVMTDNEIIQTVQQAEDPTIAAHLLTDTSVQYSSEDNSTAIVTPLGSWGKYSAAATIFHSFGKSFTSSSRFS